MTATNPIFTEVQIKATEEGWKIINVDSSKTTLLTFIIPKSSFVTYEFEKESEICMYLDNLSKIAKKLSKSPKLALIHDIDGANLTIIGQIKDEIIQYSLSLLIPQKFREPINLKFDTSIELPCNEFIGHIENIIDFNDSFTMRYEPANDKLVAEMKGNFIDAKSEIVIGPEGDYFVHEGEESIAMFTSEKIRDILKFFKSKFGKGNLITVSFTTNKPMELKMPYEEGYISYIVAPKVVREI